MQISPEHNNHQPVMTAVIDQSTILSTTIVHIGAPDISAAYTPAKNENNGRDNVSFWHSSNPALNPNTGGISPTNKQASVI